MPQNATSDQALQEFQFKMKTKFKKNKLASFKKESNTWVRKTLPNRMWVNTILLSFALRFVRFICKTVLSFFLLI